MRSDHRFAHAREPRAKTLGTDALRGDARAFEQQIELVGEHLGLP